MTQLIPGNQPGRQFQPELSDDKTMKGFLTEAREMAEKLNGIFADTFAVEGVGTDIYT